MKKRIVGIITAMTMLISAMPRIIVNAAEEVTISTAAELKAFADSVNAGNTYEGKTVSLTADIDLSEICGADINGAEVSWTPIGAKDNHADEAYDIDIQDNIFNGSFDGNGHSVSGLYINSDEDADVGEADKNYFGLFGYTGEKSVIKNLTLDGSVVVLRTISFGSLPPGWLKTVYTGALAGYNGGIIENCHNRVPVEAAATSTNVGGIAGESTGEISRCSNNADISGSSGDNAGGIAGKSTAKISKCSNYGNIITVGRYTGGIVGMLDGAEATVDNCCNLGDVSSSYRLGYGYEGGIAGAASDTTRVVKVTNSYSVGTISGENGGAIAAASNNLSAENCYYLENTAAFQLSDTTAKTASQFESGEVAYLLNGETSEGNLVWYQDIGTDDYPILDNTHKIVLFDGERYYNESTSEKHIHKICGDENCTDNHEDIEWTAWDSTDTLPTETGNYYLTKDIDLSEIWCPETAVNLCLNGHIVSCDWYQGSPDSAFTFFELTDTITLTDCSDTEHKFSLGNNGQWVLDENGTKTLKGGTVINPNGYYAITAVSAPLDMYNINITGSDGAIRANDSLNMYNCTLAGNYGTEALYIGNIANIRDCSIFENTGGGVYTGNGTLNIGGKILIKDNRYNLFMQNADAVNIVEPLAEGSYIGVNKYEDENIINITGANDTDYSRFFHSDDENYKIVNGENNVIQLVYDKDSKAYPYTVTKITVFNSLGSTVSYIPKNTEGFAIGINVHKNAESDEDVFIICALYDKDGALVGAYPAKMQSSPEIIHYREEIPAQEKVTGSIKAFVWDAFDTMKPLAETKTLSFFE